MINKLTLSLLLAISLIGFTATPALAHCPLCTLGAGAAAVGASWLGVEKVAIGVMIGGFSMALGLWMAALIKKQIFPYQKWAISLIVAVSTALPLTPMLTNYGSIYIRMSAEYGSLLNRTYLINLYLVGAIVGAVIIIAMPYLSRLITKLRKGQTISYQGVILSIFLLIISAIILQYTT